MPSATLIFVPKVFDVPPTCDTICGSTFADSRYAATPVDLETEAAS